MRRASLRAALGMLLAMSAATASAQTTSSPDPIEGAIIRFGPVGINPSLAMRDVGVDNNVFHDDVDPKSDFTFTVTPRADVLFSPRRLHLVFSTSVDYVYFQTYDSEAGTNRAAEIKANVDLGRLQPYASFAGVNTRARYNSEIDSRARHHDHTYTAGAVLHVASRTLISGAVRQTTTTFDEGSVFRGEDLAQALNNGNTAVDGSVGMQLTPLTAVSLVVSREWQRFDLDPERDSDTTRITPTVTFSAGGLLTGTAAVGYRRFSGRSLALPDFSGLVATVNVGATILGRHRLDTSFGRDLRYSYEDETPYYLSTGGTVTLTTQVSASFDVRGTATHQLLDYSQSTISQPNDTYSAYGGGVGYHLRERARIGLNAEWAHRNSDATSARAFTDNRIYATFTWGTP